MPNFDISGTVPVEPVPQISSKGDVEFDTYQHTNRKSEQTLTAGDILIRN